MINIIYTPHTHILSMHEIENGNRCGLSCYSIIRLFNIDETNRLMYVKLQYIENTVKKSDRVIVIHPV